MLSNYSVYVRNPIDLSTIRARLGKKLCTCHLFFPISYSLISVHFLIFHSSHSSYSIFIKQTSQSLLQRGTFQDRAKKCPLLPHRSQYRTPLLQVMHIMYCSYGIVRILEHSNTSQDVLELLNTSFYSKHTYCII
jgi:hypothetical protein